MLSEKILIKNWQLSVLSFVCLSVSHVFSKSHWLAKETQIFNKPSTNVKFGLPKGLNIFRALHVPVCRLPKISNKSHEVK